MTAKNYYLSLTFVNNGNETAIIEWIEPSGRKVSADVYPNSQDTRESVLTSTTAPMPINIAAVSKDTNKPMLLNSKLSVTVTPKEAKEMVTIKIGAGKRTILWNKV